MKRLLPIVLVLLLLPACGGSKNAELTVFAAASLQETLTEIGALYQKDHSNITLVFNFDSSGTLKTQIAEGTECDVFLSAGRKQMDELDASVVPAVNAGAPAETDGASLDLILPDTRVNLLENKVVLAVPEGNPADIRGFDQLAERLGSGGVLLAIGNGDVPVGQYTQKIFAYYGLDEAALAASGVLTYGSNVKEVTSQVAEAAADCGVIYATDAFSAGLTVVDEAAEEMCGQVIYPAAVLKNTAHPEDAKAFLDFLATPEAGAVFESVGFTPILR